MIKLWECFSKSPNIFKEAQNLILSRSPTAPNTRLHLIHRIHKELEDLKEWLTLAEQYQYGESRWCDLAHGAADLLRNHKNANASPEQYRAWRMIQGTYVQCCLVRTRLLYALSPLQSPDLEATSQTLAFEVLPAMTDSAGNEDDRLVGGLFMSEVVWIAKGIIHTKDIWSQESADARLEPNQINMGMIASWKFKEWCKAMGRRV